MHFTSAAACSLLANRFFFNVYGVAYAEIVQHLATVEGVKHQVELLQVERPVDYDRSSTFLALPSLQAVSGDASHLTFAAASAYGRSVKPWLVVCSRQLAEKWCAVGTAKWLQAEYFKKGCTPDRPFTEKEKRCWEQPAMSKKEAQAFLTNIDAGEAYSSRYSYLKYLAAIKVYFASELGKPTGDGKATIGKLLNTAAQWQNVEYLANGARWRSRNDIPREEVVSGTVGNEGDHADLKGWGRNVMKQKFDRCEMVLKIWETNNILCHESSFYSPNPRRNEDTQGYWLMQVLLKCTVPSCVVPEVPPTRRRGYGNIYHHH